jgi:hypothetical protein
MKTNANSTASLEPSTNAADFAERVRVNQAKLTSEVRPHYDFIVCGHFLHVSSAIIGKHRFLDKASIQPQQSSDDLSLENAAETNQTNAKVVKRK